MVALACTKLSITSRSASVQVVTREFTAKNSVSKISKFLTSFAKNTIICRIGEKKVRIKEEIILSSGCN